MLKIWKIPGSGAGDYANYLATEMEQEGALSMSSRGDYYLARDEAEAAPAMGQWLGQGAAALGLVGRAIDKTELVAAWSGHHPLTGEKLTRAGADGTHVTGSDCVFSAPKSVSLLWALTEDVTLRQGIEEAMTNASAFAIASLERDAKVMRRRVDGEIVHEASGGLVVSMFRHHTARATPEQEAEGRPPDPQLHDHAVIANLALRLPGQEDAKGTRWGAKSGSKEAGRWGAVDSRGLMVDELKAGNLHKAHLRAALEAMGLATVRTRDGYELAGFTRESIIEGSSRTIQVEQATAEYAAARGRAATNAEKGAISRETRGGKGTHPFGDRSGWRATFSTRLKWEVAGAEDRRASVGATNPNRPLPLDQITALVVGELVHGAGPRDVHGAPEFKPATEAAAVFDTNALGKALSRALAGCAPFLGSSEITPDLFGAVLARVQASPELVRLNERTWTTAKQLGTERFVRDAFVERASWRSHGLSPAVVEACIERARVPLDEEQKQAVRDMCGRKGAVLLVAEAGTGKGEVCRVVSEAHRLSGFHVLAVATSAERAQAFGAEIEADEGCALKLYTTRQQHRTRWTEGKTLVLVDEASQVDTPLMAETMEQVADAKVCLIGDPGQLEAVGASGMLPVLVDAIGVSPLTTVHRVQGEENQWALGAWRHLREGQGAEALALFDASGHVHIADTPLAAQSALIAKWDRDRIDGEARGHDVGQFKVITDATNETVDRLNRLAQECRLARNELGAKALTVTSTATKDDGREYTRTEALHAGDIVRLTDTTRSGRDALRNGKCGVVKDVDAGAAWVQFDDGSTHRIGSVDVGKLRLTYAVHTFHSQGSTVQRDYNALGGHTTGRDSSYVMASRSREQSHFFTDLETLGVVITADVDGTAVPRDADEVRAEAVKVLAERMSRDNADGAALAVPAAERSTEAGTGAASRAQRAYLKGLGVEVPADASWVDASLMIDRHTRTPEGAWAEERLKARLPEAAAVAVMERAVKAAPAKIPTRPGWSPEIEQRQRRQRQQDRERDR